MKMTPALVLLALSCLLSTTLARSQVRILDENNWEELLKGQWMVEFYAPWCPACQALEPVWNEFSTWSDDLGIGVAKIDVTTSPGLSGRFMITALPTIYHVKDGVFRQYRGSRSQDEFIAFVEESKWADVEPIPGWRDPSQVQMSVVSRFFKLSMLLRNIHMELTEEHGIPYWGSYLLFALATIIIGAVLGLVLVFIIDCFYPSKGTVSKKTPNIDTSTQPLPEDVDEDDSELDLIDEAGSESDALEQEDDDGAEEEEGVGEGEEAEEVAQEATEKASSSQQPSMEVDCSDESRDAAPAAADVGDAEPAAPAPAESPDVRRRRARKAD